ncbi:MAG TPA: M50 family metallopeptidase [Herpetosiphonaceae bacterium]|nr:M50 family metallopeptidase [Herpetosiphonaceae bacterium]
MSGLLIAVAFCLAGRQLPRRWASGLVLFLAVQMMLDALHSLLDLITVSAAMHGAATDAQIMARATGVPALIWALLWNLSAIGILVAALRIAYRHPSRDADAAASLGSMHGYREQS